MTKMVDERYQNLDEAAVQGFADEWSRFDQSQLEAEEKQRYFDNYFRIFPWEQLPKTARGFDLGCGSGRWASLVAERVGFLTCIDPAKEALEVAKANLRHLSNVDFVHAHVDNIPLAPDSQDFGYALGVLHHIPDPEAGLRRCVEKLKSRAPILIYLYYRFDNRPFWFKQVWRASDLARRTIAKTPYAWRAAISDGLAAGVYLPLARSWQVLEQLGFSVEGLPLAYYRNASFYTMRTDARDRFGTPLEHRFTRVEIEAMMKRAGLSNIRFSEEAPFWCAVGFRDR